MVVVYFYVVLIAIVLTGTVIMFAIYPLVISGYVCWNSFVICMKGHMCRKPKALAALQRQQRQASGSRRSSRVSGILASHQP